MARTKQTAKKNATPHTGLGGGKVQSLAASKRALAARKAAARQGQKKRRFRPGTVAL